MKNQTQEREYVILNMHDPSARLFTSNSVLHASRPGGSIYQKIMPPPQDSIRIINHFALQCQPIGLNMCRVSTMSWTDVATGKPSLENKLIVGWWAPYYSRLIQLSGSTG